MVAEVDWEAFCYQGVDGSDGRGWARLTLPRVALPIKPLQTGVKSHHSPCTDNIVAESPLLQKAPGGFAHKGLPIDERRSL